MELQKILLKIGYSNIRTLSNVRVKENLTTYGNKRQRKMCHFSVILRTRLKTIPSCLKMFIMLGRNVSHLVLQTNIAEQTKWDYNKNADTKTNSVQLIIRILLMKVADCEQALKTYAFIGCFGFTSLMKCPWNLLQCLMC